MVTATLARVLARLGVGQVLRLRRTGLGGTVEVQARADGALEMPTTVLGWVEGSAEGEEATGPHLLFGRHRTDELAHRLVAAIDDLELVTSAPGGWAFRHAPVRVPGKRPARGSELRIGIPDASENQMAAASSASPSTPVRMPERSSR